MGSEGREGKRPGTVSIIKSLDSWYGCKLSNLGSVPDDDFQGFFIVVVAFIVICINLCLYSSMPRFLPSFVSPTISSTTTTLYYTTRQLLVIAENWPTTTDHLTTIATTHQLMCTGTLCCRHQHTNPNLMFFWLKT
jgi:hypothetical protein